MIHQQDMSKFDRLVDAEAKVLQRHGCSPKSWVKFKRSAKQSLKYLIKDEDDDKYSEEYFG